jgi:hypothetical protein
MFVEKIAKKIKDFGEKKPRVLDRNPLDSPKISKNFGKSSG